MKAIVNQPDLVKAVSAVLGVADKRQRGMSALPILSHVLLEANGDGGIRVSATDLEVSYKGFCPARIETPGAITVPARELAVLVKDMPKGDLEIEATENHGLLIFQGEARYRLNGLDPEQFPDIQDAEAGTGFVEIPSAILHEMIERVMFSIAKDDQQNHLSCVRWENIEGQALRLIASDGHRLTVTKHRFPLMGLVCGDGILVPKKGIAELLRFLEGSETISLAVQERILIAKAGDKTLTIRLLAGRYPDYRRIIPGEFAAKYTFNREEMFRALKRLALVTSNGVKGAVFTPQGDQVVLEAESPDMGNGLEVVYWTEEKVDLPMPQVSGEEENSQEQEEAPPPDLSKFGFNIKYLLEPLAAMTSENVELEGNDAHKPFRIRAAGDDSFFGLLMPLDIS
jgi:DNA polymerase-3 subunit beta